MRYDTIVIMIGKLLHVFGPEVNMANLLPEVVLAVAAQRIRIGTNVRLGQRSRQ